MSVLRRLSAAVLGAALVTGAAVVAAPVASADESSATPLAAVLTSDGNQFDRNPLDYDIVTEAVLAVLAAKPGSPVGVLTEGDVALTAFVPTDQAFRSLVHDLTGKWVAKEADVFAAVAGLGIDTVETVLLYHVVPGATITAADALKADGAALTTAQGGTLTVKVPFKPLPLIRLVDNDTDDRDPFVIAVDVNKGNPQIAHGISQVLRPVDL